MPTGNFLVGFPEIRHRLSFCLCKSKNVMTKGEQEMARTFQFELVSPESLLLSEAVEEVVLPGCEGYLTVMVNHSPMITRIIPGVVRVRVTGKAERTFVVFGGFVDIRPEMCSLLAEAIVPIEQFDPHDIDRRIAKVRGEFEAAKTDAHRNKAEEFLYQLTTVRGVDTMA